MMKKITFFSRCELVHLYGRITPHLKKNFEINHIAYSKIEQEILEKHYNLSNVICLKDELNIIYENSKIDLNTINEIDQLIIKESYGQFCLNGAIQSDRTFEYYSYEVALLLCQSYFYFWKKYFDNNTTDYFIHEPVALFMTQIASYIISLNGAQYLTNIQVLGENEFNWIFVKGNTGELYLSNNIKNQISIDKTKKFIYDFRQKNNTILFSQYINLNHDTFNSYKYIKLIASIIRLIIKNIINKNSKLAKNALDHIENYLINRKPTTLEQIRMRIDRLFYLKYAEFDKSKFYYYYPIHMEPESTVLYWAFGYYKNQVKLIENIAAQLPPNIFLYVKDHPHGIGERNYIDYKRIKSIPNVRLINPKIPGVEVIKSSIGIITINGTGGFESYLLGKKTISFGSNFYTNMFGVIGITHIKELKKEVYKLNQFRYYEKLNYYNAINLFLTHSNIGFTDYFSNYVKKCGINEEENAKIVAAGYIKHLS